jgi:hypothetical protein
VRAEPLKFREDGVKNVLKTVLIPWMNVFRFFVSQARIYDTAHPDAPVRRATQRHVMPFVYSVSSCIFLRVFLRIYGTAHPDAPVGIATSCDAISCSAQARTRISRSLFAPMRRT